MLPVLIKVRKYLKEKSELREQQRLEQTAIKKQDVIDYLNRPMSEAEIYSINCDIIANSAGWLGGNWTENDIKLRYLRTNKNLFNDDEYQNHREQLLNSNQKIKK